MTRPEAPGGARSRVLVVEDSFLAADSLAVMIRELGFDVAGPVPTIDRALDLLEAERVDAALLDVNLRGELVTPVADKLTELGVPFLFLTGYADLDALPDGYRAAMSLGKPCMLDRLGDALRTLGPGARDTASDQGAEGKENT